MDSSQPSITDMLRKWHGGDEGALDDLLPLVYGELRRLAARQLSGERQDHTLQPAALVHEAYIRMIGLRLRWRDRDHFWRMAAKTMRRILIEHARKKMTAKRTSWPEFSEMHPAVSMEHESVHGLLDLDRALDLLSEHDPRSAQVVELFYFGGFTSIEVANLLKMSRRQVERDLRWARVWLTSRLNSESDEFEN